MDKDDDLLQKAGHFITLMSGVISQDNQKPAVSESKDPETGQSVMRGHITIDYTSPAAVAMVVSIRQQVPQLVEDINRSFPNDSVANDMLKCLQ